MIEMIEDYVRRAPGHYTIEQVTRAALDNHILVDDGCFVIFAAVQDEIHILFPYAPRGRQIEPLGRELERRAKEAGYKRIQIVTNREKAFARRFKDYHPIGVVFEKELI